jgi:hypothetical protein
MDVADLRKHLAQARRELLTRRGRRVRPEKDDKVLTAWSALMISALARAGQVLADERYARAAEESAEFLLSLRGEDGSLARSWRGGTVSGPGYLEDYVFLADALLDLCDTTGEGRWLEEARSLTGEAIRRFGDEARGGFYFTAPEHDVPLARTKDPTDNALPSANAKAVEVLDRLAATTGEDALRRLAWRAVEAFMPLARRVPRAAPTLLRAADRLVASQAKGADEPSLQAEPLAGGDALEADAVVGGRGLTLRAYTSRLAARPGGEVSLAVRMDVEKGWHVTGAQAGEGALTLSIKSPEGLALCDVRYPSAPLSDAVARAGSEAEGQTDRVGPGTSWIRARIDVAPQANPCPGVLVLSVDYQPCSPSRCETPRTERLVVPLTITAGEESPGRHAEVFGEPE